MGRELRVGAQRVDLGSGRLSGGGVLGAKQTALLGLLVDAAPHPVATARLVDALWPEGLPPGSRALSMLWSALRRKLAPDDGVLQTFRGRGYAFVGPVRFVAPGADLPGLADPGPFIGREAEIQQILDFAGGAGGWLTVTGMGGTGKTRLAAEAALRLRRGGVAAVWVDLAPQASVSGGLGAVARALGVVPGPGVDPAAAVCAALRGLDGVLVLDNMEHLLGVAPAVVDAARWANGVRVLATSRRVLGVPGEAVVRLDGLPHSGAMDLFEALALGAAPGGHYDAAAVGQLCTLLHGHPLSLELAAATLRRRPLTRLLHTLAAGRELPGESVGRPARQGSLAATFDYSWALLPGGLQRALTALSLFAGPFDAATALGSAAVAVEPIRALERHSLVGRRADDRWGLHPLVRAFAAARLPIDADARVGHRRWFLGIAGRLPAALRADDDPTLEAAITRALPDLGAAWKAAVDAGDSEAVALGWPGLEAWAVDVGHVSVGETWLATGRPLLDRPDTPVSVRTGLRRLAATTLAEAGHPAEAIAEVEAALPLAPSVSARSRLLCARAVAEWTGGDSDAASATIDTAIGLAEAEGTPEDLATALLTQSRHHAARMRGNLNVEVCQRAVRLLSDTQDHRLLRHARETLFTVQRTGSWLDEAEALGPELLAAARLRGDTAAIANVAVGMAWLRRSQGALTDALDLAAEAAEADAACGRSMAVPLALAVQASVLLELGRLDEADAVLARASALTEPYGRTKLRANMLMERGSVAMARGRPAEAYACYDEAGEHLEALLPGEPYAVVLCGLNRAWALWLAADLAAARAHFERVRPLLPGLLASFRYAAHALDALICAGEQDAAAAATAALRSLAVLRPLSDHLKVRTLVHFAGVLARIGRAPLAAALLPLLRSRRYPERWIYLPALEGLLDGVAPESAPADVDAAVARVEAAFEAQLPAGSTAG